MSSDSAVITGVFMAPGPFGCDETTTPGSTRKSSPTFRRDALMCDELKDVTLLK